MLFCDLIAAVSTMTVFVLIRTDSLEAWHLYFLNGISGLMNTVQQPASEVAATLLIPREYYQKTSGLRSFSQSLNSILTPILATALFSFAGMETVIAVDLLTFMAAFLTLWLFIEIPQEESPEDVREEKEKLLASAGKGLRWLGQNLLILKLILFLACINLVASIYNAALPAMLLSREKGGETVLGLVNTFVGIATLAGSILVTVVPKPKNRVRAICLALFVSMSTENFLLAFGNDTMVWCIGAVLGWIFVPYMNANMDVIFRSTIPSRMQGRVYACRNTLQFFSIPVGYMAGGWLVDRVFEPLMARKAEGMLTSLFGSGKGSGAAMLFGVCGVVGVLICLCFHVLLKRDSWSEAEG